MVEARRPVLRVVLNYGDIAPFISRIPLLPAVGNDIGIGSSIDDMEATTRITFLVEPIRLVTAAACPGAQLGIEIGEI